MHGYSGPSDTFPELALFPSRGHDHSSPESTCCHRTVPLRALPEHPKTGLTRFTTTQYGLGRVFINFSRARTRFRGPVRRASPALTFDPIFATIFSYTNVFYGQTVTLNCLHKHEVMHGHAQWESEMRSASCSRSPIGGCVAFPWIALSAPSPARVRKWMFPGIPARFFFSPGNSHNFNLYVNLCECLFLPDVFIQVIGSDYPTDYVIRDYSSKSLRMVYLSLISLSTARMRPERGRGRHSRRTLQVPRCWSLPARLVWFPRLICPHAIRSHKQQSPKAPLLAGTPKFD